MQIYLIQGGNLDNIRTNYIILEKYRLKKCRTTLSNLCHSFELNNFKI